MLSRCGVPRGHGGHVDAPRVAHLQILRHLETVVLGGGDGVEYLPYGQADVAAAVLGDLGGFPLNVALSADHDCVRADALARGFAGVTGPLRTTGCADILPMPLEQRFGFGRQLPPAGCSFRQIRCVPSL